MPIDKILEEEINDEIRKLGYPDGTDYVALIALNSLKSRIPQIKERIEKEMEINISQLRQWLNEDRIDNPKKMITNEDIKHWLELQTTLSLER